VHPYLFDWVVNGHPIRPPTFGVCLALSFSLGYFLALRNALVLGLNLKRIEQVFLLIIAFSILGGRLFHVVFEDWAFYSEQPLKILAVWEGGYTFYGSAITCLLGIYLFCRMFHFPFLSLMDVTVTSSALGLTIGRLGCFAAGCCWGKVCDLPWGVTFTHPDAFNNVLGVKVHPTQLYEAAGAFLIFLYCQYFLRRRTFEGEIGLKGLLLYCLLRFIVEYYRGDAYRGFIFSGSLSYSQALSAILGGLCLIVLIKKNRVKSV